MSTTLADAACRYAAQRWAVFPCHPKSKEPATPHGFKEATTNADLVSRWWRETPEANIGFTPGPCDLLVVDIDGDDGEQAAQALGLCSEPTLTVLTPRGRHLYFHRPANHVGNASLAPHLDVRCDEGYTLLPPSVHPSGAVYRWAGKVDEIKPLPPDAAAALQNGNGRPHVAPPLPERIAEGQRNQLLTSIAGSMRRRGASEGALLAALLAENAARCDPPLPEEEVAAIARSVSRYPPADPAPVVSGPKRPGDSDVVRHTVDDQHDGDALDIDPLSFTDTGNAARLIGLHGARLHYIPVWGRWLVWDPEAGRWVVDYRDVTVRELTKDIGARLKQAAATLKDPGVAKKLFGWALTSLGTHGITAAVDLARGIHGVPLDHEQLDSDGWLLGVANGVIDLHTGIRRAADPADLLTMQCPVPYDAQAEAPRWTRALVEWFPDPDVRAYVHRVAGAALVGSQGDHVLIIHVGDGSNGKSTFVRQIQRVLGPYAVELHQSLLTDTRYHEHDTVKADLFRRRLAVAVELERRVKLAEASVKHLTGGDRIRARRMREDPWAFDPTHSLWLQTNYLPEISGRDEGIWRRIRVVKWVAKFDPRTKDPALDTVLAAEASGILRWLIEGCLAWQRHRLSEPEAVIRETLAYRSKEDVFARFATETGLTFRAGLEIVALELDQLFTEWTASEGVDVNERRHELGDWLREKGARKTRPRVIGENGTASRRNVWSGVGLDAGQDHQRELLPQETNS